MSTFKKFTPQDYSIVPFNAHKQYNFTSASSATNSVRIYNTRFTSESISQYSSASSAYGGDTINNTKYNQLDNLFYRNYNKLSFQSTGDKYIGQYNTNFLKHKRSLYKVANIMSIPAGLYGHEIKPNSIFISSSLYEFKDDGYGNLMLDSDNINNYETDIRTNILNIGPIKGFKRYDLNVYEGYAVNGIDQYFYLDGIKKINLVTSYSTPDKGIEYDDSYFYNKIIYKNSNFSERTHFRGDFPVIDFNGTNSEVKIPHNGNFNFNPGDDFTVMFWANISQSNTETSYLVSKSTTKEAIPGTFPKLHNSASKPYNVPYEVEAEPQYPFEIFATGNKIFFKRSDGDISSTINGTFTLGTMTHFTCRISGSTMRIFKNGVSLVSGTDKNVKQTQNTANIYLGNKGGSSSFLSGSLSQINIFNKALTNTQVLNHYSSSNGSPYVGNVFYKTGFISITHPSYITALDNSTGGFINTLQFQGSHLIYEHEYQCTIEEHEFNSTSNISARKIKSIKEADIANFATGSNFTPYVTTVGLYNDNNELLVVGKLASPIKMSNETDTTLVLRWDT